ncbi:MAG: hypothetical protein A2539_02820 [Elusimicrobia bacterium RIFOXYD2_FULL_34_15]|nr:MAG: hypothetical protein A2539_02820 [Elusimicrobia bacterium RIFOXYD2_FULL_34_15]
MNLHIINALSAGTFSLLLGLLVYLKTKKDITLSFFLMNISISIWNFADILIVLSPNNTLALFADRIANIGAFFIIPFFIKINLMITESYSKGFYKKLFKYSIIFSVFLSIINFTKYFLKSVSINPFREEIGPLYYLFIAYFVFFSFFVLYNVLRYYLKINSPVKKLQLKYIFSGFYVGIIGVLIYFATLLNREIPPIHYYFEILYLSIFAYAIVKHRLMDIKIVVTRAGIFLVVYTFVLGLPFVFGYITNNWIYSTILMAILATFGPVAYSKLRREAENIILQEEKIAHKLLLRTSKEMSTVRELKKLFSLITHIITKYMRATNAAVYLFDNETNKYILKDIRFKNKDIEPLFFGKKDEIIAYLNIKKAPIVYEELVFHPLTDNEEIVYEKLILQFKELSAAIVVPCFSKDFLLGFLILDNKESGQIYTQDDLELLSILANQSVLAIENAIFYEETGKSLAQQFQEHRLRSLGKMGSGMAHQINNRFNLISTTAELSYLEYLPRLKSQLNKTNIKDELVNNLTDKLDKYLKIIKTEAHKGGEIARTLTSFSRNTEGYESPVVLDEVIKGSLNLLSCKFDLTELGLLYELPAGDFKVAGNLAQLQDVFFNLLDNAHDAQKKKKEEMGWGKIQLESDFKPKIIIRAKRENGFLKLEIEDNGIGMMPAQVDQTFIPFFTTKASAMKGTGLGLYVIKRMVESHREGKIEVKSEYGKGTTFFMQLPTYTEKEKNENNINS